MLYRKRNGGEAERIDDDRRVRTGFHVWVNGEPKAVARTLLIRNKWGLSPIVF
jgi:hypothetical protein